MISREEARQLAEQEFRKHGLASGVREVLLLEELSFRPPLLYGGPDLRSCWIAYGAVPPLAIRSSIVVLVDRETGAILYRGSANDEG